MELESSRYPLAAMGFPLRFLDGHRFDDAAGDQYRHSLSLAEQHREQSASECVPTVLQHTFCGHALFARRDLHLMFHGMFTSFRGACFFVPRPLATEMAKP